MLDGCIRWSGLAWLIRQAVARRRVSILMYHDPRREDLDAHLTYLGRRYSFISLDALVDALEQHDFSALPRAPLVITIDDGHRGNADLSGVLRRHGVRPVIFLTTGVVGTDEPFWLRPLVHAKANGSSVYPTRHAWGRWRRSDRAPRPPVRRRWGWRTSARSRRWSISARTRAPIRA